MATAVRGTHPRCREGRIPKFPVMAAVLPAVPHHPQPPKRSDRCRVETMLDALSVVVQLPHHGSVPK